MPQPRDSEMYLFLGGALTEEKQQATEHYGRIFSVLATVEVAANSFGHSLNRLAPMIEDWPEETT